MRHLISILVLFCFVACSNEVKINHPGEQYPVIHCLIDPLDSVHYCRVSQSFSVDGDVFANPPDEQDLILNDESYGYLEVVSPGQEEAHVLYFDTYTEMGRDSGYFPRQGNLVMKLQHKFNAGDRCILYLLLPDQEMISSAETHIVGPLTVFDPLNIPGRELTLSPAQGYTLRWYTARDAEVYQAIVNVNYTETDTASTIPMQVRIPLNIKLIDIENNEVSQFLNGRHFYKALQENIPVKPWVTRDIISLDFEIIYGSEELALAAAEAAFGKADFGNIRDYTNVDRGIGLFASRSSQMVKNIRLSYITRDSLASSLYTRTLNFQPSGKNP